MPTQGSDMGVPQPEFPRRTVILPPRLCGDIAYYAAMACYGAVLVDYGMHFDKRMKAAHRYEIADTHGRLCLTVPIAKPESARSATWGDIMVSAHGAWWNVHLTALESAYGRTPFFEYYIDRFARHLVPGGTLRELNTAIDREIRAILMIEAAEVACRANVEGPADDYTRTPLPVFECGEYYQVRADKLGFVSGLSVMDLIFNMGPEAASLIRGIGG